jgi:hypothetical protein
MIMEVPVSISFQGLTERSVYATFSKWGKHPAPDSPGFVDDQSGVH